MIDHGKRVNPGIISHGHLLKMISLKIKEK
jgi:hypothetical protein